MCGRFTLRTPLSKLIKDFEVQHVQPLLPPFVPRYNVAPTQQVLGVATNEDGKRELGAFRWGMAFDGGGGNPLINARAETVAKLPAFRDAFRSRRCLILADGFYEWLREGKKRQPFFFRLEEDRPFAFAGIWSPRRHEDETVRACALITTAARAPVSAIHARMPVILSPEDHAAWLNEELSEPAQLTPLLENPASLKAEATSTLVNSPKNDSIDCLPNPRRDKPAGQLSLFDS